MYESIRHCTKDHEHDIKSICKSNVLWFLLFKSQFISSLQTVFAVTPLGSPYFISHAQSDVVI